MMHQSTRDTIDHPRVVIIVRGGVAEYCNDEGVDVLLMDYDNQPDAVVPAQFQDLLPVSS